MMLGVVNRRPKPDPRASRPRNSSENISSGAENSRHVLRVHDPIRVLFEDALEQLQRCDLHVVGRLLIQPQKNAFAIPC